LSVARWPKGTQDTIILPPRPNCRIGGKDIVASFHTHPNTGSDYLQEPSEIDKRAIRDDPDLKGTFYVGEFVIRKEAPADHATKEQPGLKRCVCPSAYRLSTRCHWQGQAVDTARQLKLLLGGL